MEKGREYYEEEEKGHDQQEYKKKTRVEEEGRGVVETVPSGGPQPKWWPEHVFLLFHYLRLNCDELFQKHVFLLFHYLRLNCDELFQIFLLLLLYVPWVCFFLLLCALMRTLIPQLGSMKMGSGGIQ
jgi:hypothetical protein